MVRQALASADLYRASDMQALRFRSTAELEPLTRAIGQQRALEGLEFGIGMGRQGYNLVVMGVTGAGRHTVVRQILEEAAARTKASDDWCYLANFDQPHRPLALRLPAGQGRQLKQDMQHLLQDLIAALPAAFQDDAYRRRAQEIEEAFKRRQEASRESLQRLAQERKVALITNPGGVAVAPLRDGKILTTEEFNQLDAEQQKAIEMDMAEVEAALKQNMSHLPVWQREMRQQIKALNEEVSTTTIAHLIDELLRKYAALPQVTRYLARLQRDVIENAGQFLATDFSSGESTLSGQERQFNRYRVNLLVDNAETRGAPVVYEDNPSYQNLLGRVEHIASMGTLSTDFTLIKPGALHSANGGFLILDLDKVLTAPFAWDALKRALRANEVRMESLERRLSLISTVSLEPEPIPIAVKVVLIGDAYLCRLLKAFDPEFGPLFKAAADFADDLPRTADSESLYARLVAGLQQRDGLRPLSAEGVAAVIEAGARRAGHRDKISLHMGDLLDLLQEADYWAGREQAELVTAEHVDAARRHQIYRVDQVRARIHEAMLDGTLLIDTDGIQLAQVNGLSVVQLGDFAFGMPTRISATARMGSGQLIDIEREVDQGGTLHSKGVLILSAYLAWRYARHQPLSVAASLVFEQTYGLVEGDSASVAELCALLSALADIPLSQSLAITGSVSQHGEVQAIGGVCEKIEGFYDVCQARGLTGKQGVIIPLANLQSLMLRQDVRTAVAAGQFHIHAVSHVEEAMELLSGMVAGRADANGLFPAESINGRVQIRLAEWTALRQHYASPSSDENSD